jgi:hypothetical protein
LARKSYTPLNPPLSVGEVFSSLPDKGELEGVKLFINKILKKCNIPKSIPMCISEDKNNSGIRIK